MTEDEMAGWHHQLDGHEFGNCRKTTALTKWTFVEKVMSILSRLVITFLLRSKRLFISWLRSPSAVILEPRKIKSLTVSFVVPTYLP